MSGGALGSRIDFRNSWAAVDISEPFEMVTVVRVPEALEAKLRGGDICGSRVWQKRWTIALLILVGGACGRKQKETSTPRDRKQKNFSKKKAGHVAGFYKCVAKQARF